MTELKRFKDSDWKTLLPTETVEIAKEIGVTISPMGVGDVWASVKMVYNLWDNVVTPISSIYFGMQTNVSKKKNPAQSLEDRLRKIKAVLVDSKVLTILQTEVPELLERATGIHRDDLSKLPPVAFSALLIKVIDINVQSNEGLEKNLLSLTESVRELSPEKAEDHSGG